MDETVVEPELHILNSLVQKELALFVGLEQDFKLFQACSLMFRLIYFIRK